MTILENRYEIVPEGDLDDDKFIEFEEPVESLYGYHQKIESLVGRMSAAKLRCIASDYSNLAVVEYMQVQSEYQELLAEILSTTGDSAYNWWPEEMALWEAHVTIEIHRTIVSDSSVLDSLNAQHIILKKARNGSRRFYALNDEGKKRQISADSILNAYGYGSDEVPKRRKAPRVKQTAATELSSLVEVEDIAQVPTPIVSVPVLGLADDIYDAGANYIQPDLEMLLGASQLPAILSPIHPGEGWLKTLRAKRRQKKLRRKIERSEDGPTRLEKIVACLSVLVMTATALVVFSHGENESKAETTQQESSVEVPSTYAKVGASALQNTVILVTPQAQPVKETKPVPLSVAVASDISETSTSVLPVEAEPLVYKFTAPESWQEGDSTPYQWAVDLGVPKYLVAQFLQDVFGLGSWDEVTVAARNFKPGEVLEANAELVAIYTGN